MTHEQYIINATNYQIKWVEAKVTQKNNACTTILFLYEYEFTRYGLHIEIVSDRGSYIINKVIWYPLNEIFVIHQN